MTLSPRRTALLAAAASVALLATACGGTSDKAPAASAADISTCDPQGVTITASYLAQGDTAAQAAKAQLESEYPGLTVKTNELTTTTYDEATQQMVADIAVGSGPDVAMVGLGQIRFWVDQYHPQPIDPAALSDTYDQRFLDIGTVEGTPYVAPFQVSVPVLYTNTTMTEAAGVDKVPTTTSEWIADAQKIKAANGSAPIQLPRTGIADWVAQAMIQSAGATFIEPDGSPGFDSDEGRAGLDIYETVGTEKLQDPVSTDDAMVMFKTGKLAYLIHSPANAIAVQEAVGDDFEWSATAMPLPDGGEASLPAGGNGWIVLSDDACKAAFGNKLISYMLTPELIAKSSKSYSYIPVDKEAAAILAADPAVTSQVGYAWTYTGTPTAWGGWHGDATPKVNQFLQDMAQRLTSGEPLDATLDNTINRINSAVR